MAGNFREVYWQISPANRFIICVLRVIKALKVFTAVVLLIEFNKQKDRPMTRKHTGKPATPLALMPLSVDVDLVRFEKNLLQIGFFGANDARDKNRTSRRIEQVVIRNGQKIKVAAEFRGSEQLGLPSTADRDKFIALLKIISEGRARIGQIENPVRFSGYRMIKELGLARNGEIYEEILRWGKRMTDTTITSEKVVYRAAKKVYSDEVLHVFRSFRRTGNSNLNGTEKKEHFEVVLEDWLLENLNQRYVIPEDFNAYKQLTRPTAKGIFGNLHLWFHASQGRQVEKDYAELCNLLNVQAYPHLSKIRSTMGLALQELVNIRYLSQWDVQPMLSKQGYKIVLTPGDELLRLLDNSRPERRETSIQADSSPMEAPDDLATGRGTQQVVLEQLQKHGILPSKAKQLLDRYGSAYITDTIEYLESQIESKKGKQVANPAGLIIYSLENNLPIPVGFVTSRQRHVTEEEITNEKGQRHAALKARLAYADWCDWQTQKAIDTRYSEVELSDTLAKIAAKRSRTDKHFSCVLPADRNILALQILRQEVRGGLVLPHFEEWLLLKPQKELF